MAAGFDLVEARLEWTRGDSEGKGGGDLDERIGILSRPTAIVEGPFEDARLADFTVLGGRNPSTIVVERAEAKVFKRAEIWSKDGNT
jgi:hypothetical protein